MTIISLVVIFFREPYQVLFVVVGSLLVIQFVKKGPKPLLFFGSISYSLYLCHNVLVTRFNALLYKVLPHFNPWLGFFASVAFCVLFAWGFSTVIEKPIQRLSKRLNRKPATQTDNQTTGTPEIVG